MDTRTDGLVAVVAHDPEMGLVPFTALFGVGAYLRHGAIYNHQRLVNVRAGMSL